MWWSRTHEVNMKTGCGKVQTWEEMKFLLKEIFLPLNYRQILLHKFYQLQQGDSSIEKYTKVLRIVSES